MGEGQGEGGFSYFTTGGSNETGGLNKDGAMVLNGFIYGYGAGTTPFRGIWTAEENGDVIQHFDIYNKEKEVWNVWFDGLYVPKETDPSPPKEE